MQASEAFRARNPAAKLVCIDLQPNRTTQAAERADVLNVGGFSDAVFDVLSAFAPGGLAAEDWVDVIEAVALRPHLAPCPTRQEGNGGVHGACRRDHILAL